MLKRLLLAFAALLMLPSAAAAETLEGAWALRIDDVTIFRFDLQQAGDGSWSGVWTRPRSYRNNGVILSNMEGRYEAVSHNGQAQGDAVRLTFDNPRTRSLPETLRFRVTGEGTAQFTYVDTGFAPFPLVRVAQDVDIGPFTEGRLYDRDSAQTEPTALAAPQRGELAPAPKPEAEPEVAAPARQPETELPAVSEPDQVREPRAELPPVAPAVQTPEPAAQQAGAWQPDAAVSAAVAARAAMLEGSAAPATEVPEPEAAPAPPPPAPRASEAEAWQPDPSVSAAIAARAAALEGAGDSADAPEAEPEPEPETESGLGDDFLEGL